MSTYYNFFIGYIDNKTKKVYAIGPYDNKSELKSIFYKTSSFISELYKEFAHVDVDRIDDSIKEEFTYTWNKTDGSGTNTTSNLYVLPVEDLPDDNFVKSGYFLIKDVEEYLKDSYDFDGFYETVDPILYAEMVKQEVMFGKPKPEKDEEGYEIPVYSASDYMYFAYPDYNSMEYEVHRLRLAYSSLYCEYDHKNEDITPVILLCID